ncbi:MAG: hypothetical protein ABR923_06955 [Terracidiphilus sp.]
MFAVIQSTYNTTGRISQNISPAFAGWEATKPVRACRERPPHRRWFALT